MGCLHCLSEAVSQVSNIQGIGKRIFANLVHECPGVKFAKKSLKELIYGKSKTQNLSQASAVCTVLTHTGCSQFNLVYLCHMDHLIGRWEMKCYWWIQKWLLLMLRLILFLGKTNSEYQFLIFFRSRNMNYDSIRYKNRKKIKISFMFPVCIISWFYGKKSIEYK